MKEISKIPFYTSFLFSFVVGLYFYLFGFDSFYFFDDAKYIRYANELSEGILNIRTDNFYQRFGFTTPIAFIINTLGFNRFSLTLWPFLCWLISVGIINYLFRKNTLVHLLTFLMAFDFYFIFFSNKVYPDIALVFIAILLYVSIISEFKQNIFKYLLISFLLVWGIMTKVTFLYLFPGLAIYYLFIEKNLKANLYIILFFNTILLLVGIFYLIQKGDFLYIFNLIENSHYSHSESYFDKSNWEIIKRLTYTPFIMMISSGMIIPLIFSFFTYLPSIYTKLKPEEKLAPILVMSILISFWFGSTSLRFYSPMSLQPRMILLLLPFLIITISYSYQHIMSKKNNILLLSILWLFISIICYINIYPQKAFIYFLISVLFILSYLFYNKKLSQKILIFWTIILAIQPIYSASKAKEFAYESEEKIMQQTISKLNGYVLVDGRTSSNLEYYFKFSTPKNIQLIDSIIPNFSYQNLYFLYNSGFQNYFKSSNYNTVNESSLKNYSSKIITQENGVILYQIFKNQ